MKGFRLGVWGRVPDFKYQWSSCIARLQASVLRFHVVGYFRELLRQKTHVMYVNINHRATVLCVSSCMGSAFSLKVKPGGACWSADPPVAEADWPKHPTEAQVSRRKKKLCHPIFPRRGSIFKHHLFFLRLGGTAFVSLPFRCVWSASCRFGSVMDWCVGAGSRSLSWTYRVLAVMAAGLLFGSELMLFTSQACVSWVVLKGNECNVKSTAQRLISTFDK